MFSRNRDHNTRAEQPGRNMTGRSQRPRCCCPPGPRTVQDFSKEPPTCDAGRGINISGVDFWHAVEFSRNGRFLRSRFTGALRALPFVLAFPTLSDSFVSDSQSKRVTAVLLFAFQFFAFRVSLSGESDSTRFFFVPFPVRIRFQRPAEWPLPFGGPDFIRDSESDFPPPLEGRPGAPCAQVREVLPVQAEWQTYWSGAPRCKSRRPAPGWRPDGRARVRPRRRPEGSSDAGGRCRTPTCPPCAGPAAGAGAAPSPRPGRTC
ncbi:hypothetical protein OKW18_001882 [Streptomyces pratensis]|nr:hypothetical protein [Streptomyces pratensis]